MKFTAIILLSAALQVSANGHSQGITLKVKDKPLDQVFIELQKQSGYNFVYTGEVLKNAGTVTLDIQNKSLEEVLKLCLKDKPLTYSIVANIVVIKVKPSSPNEETTNVIPPIDVSGKITDKDGNPLAGANVKVKGTAIGTSTNETGEFILKNIDEGATIEISFVGFQTQTVNVKNKSVINISLVLAVKELDQTVIIGYGTTTRRFSTGDVTKVTGEEISKQPVTNPLEALEGRVPGMFIQKANGFPGSNISVRIRGTNSLAAGNNPLYIIDGVPFQSSMNELRSSNGLGAISPLNSISPDDIESIEVLKDADATAIYGSRAANGVVLITTKKGKTGKTQVSFNISSGQGKATHLLKFVDPQQYLQMRHEAFANDGLIPSSNPAAVSPFVYAPDLLVWDTTKTTDWQKYILGGTANYTDVSLTMSGGDNNNKFFFGSSYHKETTVYPTDNNYRKGSFHLNVGHASTNGKFNADFSVTYTTDNNYLPTEDLTFYLKYFVPTYQQYDNNGKYQFILNQLNPTAYLKRTNNIKTNNLVAGANIRYNLLQGLNFKANLSYNNLTEDSYQAEPASTKNPANNPTSFAQFGDYRFQTYNIEPQLEYNKRVSNGKLDILIGSAWQQTINKQQFIFANNFPSEQLMRSLGAGILSQQESNITPYKYQSVFGRINYNLLNKYIINGSFRRDGSSRFGPDKQFGNFGSIGAAWLFSEEAFTKEGIPWLDYGKLKASYGTVGNDNIADYGYLSTYRSVSTPYGTIPGIMPARLANPEYRWEQTKKFETSLDLGFFKSRILLSASWYQNRSSNELVSAPVASQTGFTSYQANLPALVQNTGWEFTLNTINVEGKNLKWNTTLNVTLPKNKLVSFDSIAKSPSYANRYAVGNSLTSIYGYHYLGVDPATGIGMVQDINNNGTINFGLFVNGKGDYIKIGDLAPKFYGGLTNSVQYKGWQLDFLFQFIKQVGYIDAYSTGATPGTATNQPIAILDHWQKPGDNSFNQKLSVAGAAPTFFLNQFLSSDAVVTDASYIRLKNLALSYSLPSKWTSKLKMTNARIYLQGQNLLTITNYPGYDPEVQATAHPLLKVITAGIQCNF